MDTAPLLYRAEEGARSLEPRARMFELLAAGEVESVQIGRSRRIPAQALEDYVARLRSGQAADPSAA